MKNRFIENELWYLSISGAFQRNKIYAVALAEKDTKQKDAFKNLLRNSIFELSKQYSNVVSDEQHVSNILNLILINQNPILYNNGKLTFGTMQKLLNLYLKYLWCTDRLKQIPPHCPVDSIILQKSTNYKDHKWTQLDCKEKYMLYINDLRELASARGMLLAEWELDVFNRRAEVNVFK